jgi:hypothetical protein
MPWVVAIAALASAAAGAYAAVKQGDAAEEAGQRTKEAENSNALAAQQQAALEAGQIRRKNLVRMGEQRATAAKSGVLIDASAGDVIYDTSIQGELEAQSALYSGATAASYYKSRGSIAALEGKNAKSASRIQAGSTVLGGLSSAASKYPKNGGAANSRSAEYNRRGPQ